MPDVDLAGGVPVTGVAPRQAPLTYPGTAPTSDGVLAGWTWHPCTAAQLDDGLAALGEPPMAERTPVLAVGSNADLAQVATKLDEVGAGGAVPMAAVAVPHLRVGAVPMASSWGYVPAAPVLDAQVELDVDLTVAWWTADQLVAIDATEAGPYRRVPLPTGSTPVVVSTGAPVRRCQAYASTRGLLADHGGRPRDLGPQDDLLAWILAEVPALAQAVGGTPQGFVDRTRIDAGFRREVARRLQAAGLVVPHPWPT
jgi:hypothetical protein